MAGIPPGWQGGESPGSSLRRSRRRAKRPVHTSTASAPGLSRVGRALTRFRKPRWSVAIPGVGHC
jgi:hypothetical protein